MEDEYKNLASALKKNNIMKSRAIKNNIKKIDVILGTGITIKTLVEKLNEYGFMISFDSFKVSLRRARNSLNK